MSVLRERLKQRKFDDLTHEAILSLMVTANQLKEKQNDFCEETGISLQHFNILRILKGKYPDGHPRCEIAERMIDGSPDITRLVDKLVRSGLVKRVKSTQDMRQSVAVITEQGIKLLDKLNQEIEQFGIAFKKTLGEDDLKRIVSICDKILRMV